MVGHQLLISLAYYNLALQLYFNESTTCYLKGVMMVPKKFSTQNPGGCTCTPLHACGRPCQSYGVT